MITNKSEFAGQVVNAHRVDLIRGDSEEHSRFISIVDDKGHECGAVSQRYRLIRNGDLLGALDLASDKAGMDLEIRRWRYYNGRFTVDLSSGALFRAPGDKSETQPYLRLVNGYGGVSTLDGLAGMFRLACTNGTLVGKYTHKNTQKHVGKFNLMNIVGELLFSLKKQAEVQKIIAEAAGHAPFVFLRKDYSEQRSEEFLANRRLLTEIVNSTPKKYHPSLIRAFEGYAEDVGSTVWAILQAISEVSTHDMKGTLSGDAWQLKQTNRVLQFADIEV